MSHRAAAARAWILIGGLGEEPAGQAVLAAVQDPDPAVVAEQDAASGVDAERPRALRAGQRVQDLLVDLDRRRRPGGRLGVAVCAARRVLARLDPQDGQTARSAYSGSVTGAPHWGQVAGLVLVGDRTYW